MDKGAHFYKCDFQVHTPRDLNWSGDDAVDPEGRKAYAEELIHACRVKGIDAIAITDHHDFAFFPFIKKAAQDELDETGQLIPENKRIVIFPGLELTLTAPNCQAILILDSDFPENLLESVLTILAIAPASPLKSKQSPIQRIPQNVISDLKELYQKLNTLEYLKDRFIVLPNVSESGHGTILRSGFANFYKSMPCVGGYTDKPVDRYGTGALSIVFGQNRDYGFKAIGIFQTSDNRKRNHEDLGKNTTWVKWSEPTAEALRQACLARESRLSQTDPELPYIWIISIDVSNSKFLGRIALDLNQQYNALIGGRGTGKSTILEYLRWGLCDQPVENYDSDIAPVQIKRKRLIDDTLQIFDGEITVTFLLNNVKHIVKRSTKNQEILLKIGENNFVNTSEQEIRNLLPVQAYSQKQLSNVGVRIEELKRFVELPIRKELEQIRVDIADITTKIKTTYPNIIRKKEIETEISKNNLEIASLQKQSEGFRQGLKGLSIADQEIIDLKKKYDNEQQIIENYENELLKAKELVESIKIEFSDDLNTYDTSEIHNQTLIRKIEDLYKSKFKNIESIKGELLELFNEESLSHIDERVKEWDDIKNDFDKKYDGAKAAANVNQKQLIQIQGIEKRITELKKHQMENRNALKNFEGLEVKYQQLRKKWDIAHTDKIEALDNQCIKFSTLSNGLIRAEIVKSLDINLLMQKIKIAFAGMNIKEPKIEVLSKCVLNSPGPMSTWNRILSELEKLAVYSIGGPEPLPDTPIMNKCGFIENEKKRIAESFDWEKWLALSVVELEFNPKFSYCTNQETAEYIDFADASAGQQATALLTVLLNQRGAPLIIDQPEDDIESKLVKDIVGQIWKAKSNRQLIFASHNANFVVNGDAELVICCDYIRAGDQTGGQIKAVGAIDNKLIREEITSVTEGGKEAFKLRMEKYGF